MSNVASFTKILLIYQVTCTIFSLFCLLQPCCWLVEVTVKALNVYKKYIFLRSRTCRHEFCYEKNGFLLNVENCIELTYWHVKSIQNLSCSDKRMTPLSISLKVKYISILAIVILGIFTKAYLLFHKAPLKYWHHDWYSRKNAQSISPLYLVKLLGGSNACILLTIIVLRL